MFNFRLSGKQCSVFRCNPHGLYLGLQFRASLCGLLCFQLCFLFVSLQLGGPSFRSFLLRLGKSNLGLTVRQCRSIIVGTAGFQLFEVSLCFLQLLFPFGKNRFGELLALEDEIGACSTAQRYLLVIGHGLDPGRYVVEELADGNIALLYLFGKDCGEYRVSPIAVLGRLAALGSKEVAHGDTALGILQGSQSAFDSGGSVSAHLERIVAAGIQDYYLFLCIEEV